MRKIEQLDYTDVPGVKAAFKNLIKSLLRKLYVYPMKKIKHNLRLPYRKFRIKFTNEPIVVYQFVFTEPDGINFGDELTKEIITKLFKKRVIVSNAIDRRFDILGVGSLIHFFNEVVDYKIFVWGSGLIDNNVKRINQNFIFKACRGSNTRSKLSEKYKDIPLGDPGLLCNLIYKNKVKETKKIGVIAHYRDEQSNYLNSIIKKHPEIFTIISVSQSPKQVADKIRGCRLILSSSLHGLIVSDSFGVPNIHLKLSDNLKSPHHLRGGEYKFRDYYSGIGKKYANFDPRTKDLLNLQEYEKLIQDYEPIKDLVKIQDRLIRAFPYK